GPMPLAGPAPVVRADTVTASPLGADRVTGNDAVPLSFGVVTSAMETDGGPSSSRMVPAAEAWASVALAGAERATVKVSSPSSRVSPTMGTGSAWLRSPAAKLTVVAVPV